MIKCFQIEKDMVAHAKRIIKNIYIHNSSTSLHATEEEICQSKFGRVKTALYYKIVKVGANIYIFILAV